MFLELHGDKGWRYVRKDDIPARFSVARLNIFQIKTVHKPEGHNSYYIDLTNDQYYYNDNNKEEIERVDAIIAKCTMLGLLAGSN